MKIQDLPDYEKPREKALHFGLSALSNREVLAIILRHGYHGKSVLEICDEILEKSQGLQGLGNKTVQELCQIDGISTTKALTILASIELAKRIQQSMLMERKQIESPKDIITWMQYEIGFSQQEQFVVLFLDSAGKLIQYDMMFKGTLNQSMVYPRDLVTKALNYHAANLILVHNHPSQSLQPSKQDIALTTQVIKIASYFDLTILDHLIIGAAGYYSFTENHLLQKCYVEAME